MDRQTALVLTIIFFVFFLVLTYFGAQITFWSSIVFSTFVCLILLNIFYPPGQAASDDADYTLVLYGVIEVLGLLLLGIYVTERTLTDTRECNFCSI
jgi:hypothetical protein